MFSSCSVTKLIDTTIRADVFAVYIPLYVILRSVSKLMSRLGSLKSAVKPSCAGIVRFQNARQQTILVSSTVRA